MYYEENKKIKDNCYEGSEFVPYFNLTFPTELENSMGC